VSEEERFRLVIVRGSGGAQKKSGIVRRAKLNGAKERDRTKRPQIKRNYGGGKRENGANKLKGDSSW
jgi:hypothetical protein